VAGDVTDIGDAEKANIVADIAAAAGVAVDAVEVHIHAGSVVIDVTIHTTSETATAVQETVAERIATPQAAEAIFRLTPIIVTATPTPPHVSMTSPTQPRPPRATHPPSAMPPAAVPPASMPPTATPVAPNDEPAPSSPDVVASDPVEPSSPALGDEEQSSGGIIAVAVVVSLLLLLVIGLFMHPSTKESARSYAAGAADRIWSCCGARELKQEQSVKDSMKFEKFSDSKGALVTQSL